MSEYDYKTLLQRKTEEERDSLKMSLEQLRRILDGKNKTIAGLESAQRAAEEGRDEADRVARRSIALLRHCSCAICRAEIQRLLSALSPPADAPTVELAQVESAIEPAAECNCRVLGVRIQGHFVGCPREKVITSDDGERVRLSDDRELWRQVSIAIHRRLHKDSAQDGCCADAADAVLVILQDYLDAATGGAK